MAGRAVRSAYQQQNSLVGLSIALRGAIHEVRPDIVLCVGQAGGRVELCLERVAINVQDARIRDNAQALGYAVA